MIEIRCDSGIMFGVVDNGILEVKCRSNRCGHGPGVVVLHQFSVVTGELLGTRRFKDPTTQVRRDKKEMNHT